MKILLILSCLFSTFWVSGQSIEYSLKKAIKKSTEENKPILLDLYTDWCGPCKVLDRKIFSDSLYIKGLSQDFIILKLNGEKSPGDSIVQTHGVFGYPTLMVIQHSQELDRHVGYLTKSDLNSFLILAKDPLKNWQGLKKRLSTKTISESELNHFVENRIQFRPKKEQYNVLTSYLHLNNLWRTSEAGTLLFTTVSDASSPLFDSLVSHKQIINKKYESIYYENRIAQIVENHNFGKIKKSKKEAKKLVKRAYPSQVDSVMLRYRMRLAREAGNVKKFAKLALKWEKKYPPQDPDELSELVYIFNYKLPGKKKKYVIRWCNRLLALRPDDQQTKEILLEYNQ